MMFERAASRLAISSIRFYQRYLSRRLDRFSKCRFYPTCSQYAIVSIEKYGLKAGLVKTYGRLLRCRPDNIDSCIDFP